MEKKTQVDLGSYFNLPNPNLRAFFESSIRGQSDDYRTPFWNEAPRDTVLDQWDHIFSSLDVDASMPGLTAFEYEMRDKVGPYSIRLPLRDQVEGIESYYTAVHPKKRIEPIHPRAILEFLKTLSGVRGVTLRSESNVVSHMRLNTNSGAPEFKKRRLVADETLDYVIDRNDLTGSITYKTPSGALYKMCAIKGWRGQEGGPEPDDVKQRVVWMMPMFLNMLEAKFYQPAILAWQARGINPAYNSFRAVEVKITRLFDTKGDNYVVVTDFSKFDQHFNESLQDAARCSIEYMLERSPQSQEWLHNIFPIKYRIPLVCSEDLMYTGFHGMASGSTGTNFDECCAHSCMQHEAAIFQGKRLNPYSNAYGDDGYLSFEGIDVDKVIRCYESHGQDLNPDKQTVDKHSAVYLRRYFHDSYRDKQGIMLGVYSTFRALGRLLGQERYYDPAKWSKELVVLRALSILENCSNSPVFHEFVDFVLKGDKLKLGLAIPGFFERGHLKQVLRDANDVRLDLTNYMEQEAGNVVTSGGILDWNVVKYLLAK